MAGTARAPFVSVIILNYNGKRYLPACLDALRASSYPEDCFEVIVSDNGSTDGSLELLQTQYPWVRVLANGRNLGFASGNNVAINAARGQYVVLLNNDTAPAQTWLENLVNVAESDPRVGMVTGRLQLFYDQLVLRLEADAFVPPNDGRTLGVQVFQVDSGTPGGVAQYLKGFYGWEEASGGQRFRWTTGDALLGVPVPPGAEDWDVRLHLAAARSDNRPVRLRVFMQNTLAAEWLVSGIAPSEYALTMPAAARLQATPLVQNAGSIIFRDGSGRDRGTFVRDFQVLYETDADQYNRVEEVFAGCGASLLINKSMLQDVGMLDDDFFMYYEDTDLAWRARSRGWKVLYAPQAIVRHIHCGTSQEWSPTFIYYADRNRLAMLFKNGAWRRIFWAWGKYGGRLLRDTLKTMRFFLQKRSEWRVYARHALIQCRVLRTLFRWLPGLWRKRREIQKRRSVSASAIEVWFVD